MAWSYLVSLQSNLNKHSTQKQEQNRDENKELFLFVCLSDFARKFVTKLRIKRRRSIRVNEALILLLFFSCMYFRAFSPFFQGFINMHFLDFHSNFTLALKWMHYSHYNNFFLASSFKPFSSRLLLSLFILSCLSRCLKMPKKCIILPFIIQGVLCHIFIALPGGRQRLTRHRDNSISDFSPLSSKHPIGWDGSSSRALIGSSLLLVRIVTDGTRLDE